MASRHINNIWEDIDEAIKQRTSLKPGELLDRLIKILTSPKEIAGWEEYALEDTHRYTRNLIHPAIKFKPSIRSVKYDESSGMHKNNLNEEVVHDLPFHLVLLAWGPGHSSAIHDHAGSECCMRVLSGTLREELFQVAENLPAINTEGKCLLQLKHSNTIEQGGWTSIRDSIGWHRVLNTSSSEPAYSVHLYYPPIGQHRVICAESQVQYSVKTCHFHSINGHLCQ